LYVPYLPLPPIGVHKTIAEGLSLNPGEIYQAIKAIRLEMNLPQYNDPSLHGLEPITGDKKSTATLEQEQKESQEEKTGTNTTAASDGASAAPAEVAPAEPVEVATSSTVDSTTTQE
jgi:hypothetical protein